MRQRLFYFGSVIALAAVYFACGKFGLSLALVNASATAVWPPTGISLAALLLLGNKLWPGVFLGAFLVNLTTQGSAETAVAIATGNTIEAVTGAWLVNRFAGGARAFEHARNIFRFVLFASIFSTAISASFGTASLLLGGLASRADWSEIWLTWWLGDLVGSLIVAPLLLIWSTQPWPTLSGKRLSEVAGLLVVILVAGQIVFVGHHPFTDKHAPLGYIALLPLLWAAFRFLQLGAVTAAFISSTIAIWGTLGGYGPFISADANQSLLYLQAYIAGVTLTTLVLAAVVSERSRADQRLKTQHAVSRVLAESPSWETGARKSLEAIREIGDWTACAIWEVDRECQLLICRDAWSVPRRPGFEECTLQSRHKQGDGLPGQVWEKRDLVWMDSISEALGDSRLITFRKEGLRSVMSFPVQAQGEVVAVFECFCRHVRIAEPVNLLMLGEITNQLEQFLERMKAEAALRESEARLRLVLDTALDAVIAADHSGRITEWNPQAENILGYNRQEALGRTVAEMILPPELDVSKSEDFLRALRTATGPLVNRRFEMVALRKDGVRFPAEIAMAPATIGKGTRMSIFLRDISDRKRTEAALEEARSRLKAHADQLESIVQQRTTELRETIAELESFSYSISHDMRAPLRAMQGYASILAEELKGRISDEQLEFLTRITAASGRLANLVRDILSYSRVSRMKLPLGPVDLQTLVEELIQQNTAYQPPHAHMTIATPLPMVLGHEVALTEICANLFSNAVKFVRPGSAPRIVLSARTEGTHVRVSVVDEGIGIDPKNHDRIFHMFERVNSAKDFDGTGIGLAIARKALERMNGQIGVNSELGKGSEFWFTLPRVPAVKHH